MSRNHVIPTVGRRLVKRSVNFDVDVVTSILKTVERNKIAAGTVFTCQTTVSCPKIQHRYRQVAKYMSANSKT